MAALGGVSSKLGLQAADQVFGPEAGKLGTGSSTVRGGPSGDPGVLHPPGADYVSTAAIGGGYVPPKAAPAGQSSAPQPIAPPPAPKPVPQAAQRSTAAPDRDVAYTGGDANALQGGGAAGQPDALKNTTMAMKRSAASARLVGT